MINLRISGLCALAAFVCRKSNYCKLLVHAECAWREREREKRERERWQETADDGKKTIKKNRSRQPAGSGALPLALPPGP